MSRVLLALQELQVGYLNRSFLPPIDVEISTGELWGIAGSNGSGKSTLLKTILGLMPSISGTTLRSGNLRIGYVPQRTSLDLSIPARAIDVVRGGATRGWSFANLMHTHRNKHAIEEAMETTNVTSIATEQLSKLSEGQKQRVLMARALVGQPQLLILDEPTSAMDSQSETRMLELLDELRIKRSIGIVLVSHNLMAMSAVATHALMLDREHQLIVSGDIRNVAVHHEVHEHFGRLMRVVVEERFGPLPDPDPNDDSEVCHVCD